MPRYYFDVTANGALVTDRFGIELDGFDEAREQAIALLPDMARDELPEGEWYEFSAFVRGPDGRVHYRAKLVFEGCWMDPPLLEAAASPTVELIVNGSPTTGSPVSTDSLASAGPEADQEAEPKPSRNAPRQSPITSIA